MIKLSFNNSRNEDKSPLSTSTNNKRPDVSSLSDDPRAKSLINMNINTSFDPVKRNLTNQKNQLEAYENFDKFNKKESGVNASNIDQSISCCLICFENAPDSVFMDCGHGGMCYICATDIFKKTGECYLCRKVIKQVLLLDLQNKEGNYFKVKASTRMVTSKDENNNSKNSENFYIS